MRSYILGVLTLIVGCAPQYTETRLQPGDTPPVNQARFKEEPKLLHEAFAASCRGPADDYQAKGEAEARCETIPNPDIAAVLVLRYGDALEIPHIVVERETEADEDGFLVTFRYFASVPLQSGAEQRVYLRSSDLDRTIDDMFRTFGGNPI